MAAIVWKEDALVNIKLRDDLYTIGQMLISPAMRFYDIVSKDDAWQSLDLNNVNPLFQVYIGQTVLQRLAVGKIREKSVMPSNLPLASFWIHAHANFDGGFPWQGGRLVDVDARAKIGAARAPIIKQELRLPEDREIIENVELTNMWGVRILPTVCAGISI